MTIRPIVLSTPNEHRTVLHTHRVAEAHDTVRIGSAVPRNRTDRERV